MNKKASPGNEEALLIRIEIIISCDDRNDF